MKCNQSRIGFELVSPCPFPTTITTTPRAPPKWRNSYRRWFPKEIIWRLQVQPWLQASNNTGILNTCTQLWLAESEQTTPEDSIKDVVRSSVKVPEFDKHLKKAGGYIGRNVVEITIKMKAIVWKPLMIKMRRKFYKKCQQCSYFWAILLVNWFVGFNGMSTFLGLFMPGYLSRSLYIQIYNFCVVIFLTPQSYRLIFKQIYLTHR